jgi:hypothetical protein
LRADFEHLSHEHGATLRAIGSATDQDPSTVMRHLRGDGEPEDDEPVADATPEPAEPEPEPVEQEELQPAGRRTTSLLQMQHPSRNEGGVGVGTLLAAQRGQLR